MKAFFARIQTRMKSLRGDEEGFVVMATLGIFLMLFVLCASIYAVGETARQKIRIQNACDAAAYSAAVVQADGLSRMASINRAMAETYVHMTNLQMDYITYRWMRLTEKRFREDYNNAKAYHQWMITNFNPEEGWIGLIASAANAYIMRAVGAKCNLRHDKEGIGWWCGRGPNTNHNIMLNGHRVGGGTSSYEKLVQAIDKRTSFMGDGSVAGIQGKDESENDAHDRDTVDYSARQKSEQEKIDAEYEGKIRALDPEDPEYESKRAKLEHERDTKKDEKPVKLSADWAYSTRIMGQTILDKIGASAEAAAETLGSGYSSNSRIGKTRVVAEVTADTIKAKVENAKNNTLLKALGALRK